MRTSAVQCADLIKVAIQEMANLVQTITGNFTVLNNGGLMQYRMSTTNDRREYKRLRQYRDPYDEELYYWSSAKPGRVGWWTRKGLFPGQARSYRTWKHNRKTQYK